MSSLTRERSQRQIFDSGRSSRTGATIEKFQGARHPLQRDFKTLLQIAGLQSPSHGFPLIPVKRKSYGDRSHGDKNRQARENRHVKPATEEKPVPSLDEHDLMRIVAEIEVPFLLILDCVQDPHNLGAILRTADGAGVHAVIAPKDKAVGITETVRRISVGAADHVPFVQVTNLARTMEQLKEAGVWFVGTSDRAEKTLYELDLKGPLALVLGAEEKGMRRLTEENCDFLAKLPMAGQVECLNVSVATGVCLFEAVRQRRVEP